MSAVTTVKQLWIIATAFILLFHALLACVMSLMSFTFTRGGGMIGVEFVLDRKTKEPAHDLCERVMELAFERGLLTLSCGKSVMRIAPALSIKPSEIDEGLQIFEQSITLAEKEAGV